MPDLVDLQTRLGYTFNDVSLLTLALTHPSVLHESPKAPSPERPHQTNQRLEFLGDAVLQLVLSQALFARYPQFPEGDLTKARAKLVNGPNLAEQARRLDLGLHMVVSRGEESTGGRHRVSALADTFEAVLGAVFIDGEYEAARKVILAKFEQELSSLDSAPSIANPKGELQEFLQAKFVEGPVYKILSSKGPDHDRCFLCEVSHLGKSLATGQGKSKKEAEAAAALAALLAFRGEHVSGVGL